MLTLPLSWDEIRDELATAYADRIVRESQYGAQCAISSPIHVCVELADGATLEIISPRLGAMPSARNLAGCRILILRPLSGVQA